MKQLRNMFSRPSHTTQRLEAILLMCVLLIDGSLVALPWLYRHDSWHPKPFKSF